MAKASALTDILSLTELVRSTSVNLEPMASIASTSLSIRYKRLEHCHVFISICKTVERKRPSSCVTAHERKTTCGEKLCCYFPQMVERTRLTSAALKSKQESSLRQGFTLKVWKLDVMGLSSVGNALLCPSAFGGLVCYGRSVMQ